MKALEFVLAPDEGRGRGIREWRGGHCVPGGPVAHARESTPSRKAGAILCGPASLADGTADDDRLASIAERYGMDVIGPVPEGYL